ncbi:MAG: hypothetical protein ACJ8NR_17420 [Sulfurifustis sp.]
MSAVLFFAASLAAAGVSASTDDAGNQPHSLSLSHRNFTLDYGSGRVDTKVADITLIFDGHHGERWRSNIFGGLSYLTQTDNPSTGGLYASGIHAGASADVYLVKSTHFDVFLHTALLFRELDPDDGRQRVTIETTELDARVGASTTLGNVRAYAGRRYGRIEGEQRVSGTTNETRDFHETRRTGNFAGLELPVQGRNYVGVMAESGVDRNIAVYYGRMF